MWFVVEMFYVLLLLRYSRKLWFFLFIFFFLYMYTSVYLYVCQCKCKKHSLDPVWRGFSDPFFVPRHSFYISYRMCKATLINLNTLMGEDVSPCRLVKCVCSRAAPCRVWLRWIRNQSRGLLTFLLQINWKLPSALHILVSPPPSFLFQRH